MSQSKTYHCDICGETQDASTNIYWASQIGRICWKVPPDGLNGGYFDGDACRNCREAICKAIETAVLSLKKTSW